MTLSGAIVVAAALAAVSACGEAAVNFDKAGWAAERGNYSGKSRRGELASGLAAAGIKPGAARAAVRELLGEPDSTGPEADIYFLGRSATGPSFESYRIDYSPAGVVTAARLERS